MGNKAVIIPQNRTRGRGTQTRSERTKRTGGERGGKETEHTHTHTHTQKEWIQLVLRQCAGAPFIVIGSHQAKWIGLTP